MTVKGTFWELGMNDRITKVMGALAGVSDKVAGKFVNLQDKVNKFETAHTAAMKRATSQNEMFGNSLSGIGSKIGALVGAYASFEFGKEILNTTSKFEALNNVINFTSLNAKDAAANHDFLSRIIKDYKLPMEETTEGFSQLNAAMLGSKLQGEGARKIFEGVSVASTALHLSGDNTKSVFLALNQMMSKGKVQAQELTLQLGQALPGAMRLASQSMGMSTAEFMKQMEKGAIASEVFLPKFAELLKNQFSGAIPNAIQSLQSRTNEMNNAFIKMKLTLGEELHPAFISIMSGLVGVMGMIKPAIGWIKAHSTAIKTAAVFVGALVTGYYAWIAVMKVKSVFMAIHNTLLVAEILGLTGAATAQIALNVAMNAMGGPIGLILVGLAAIAAAFYKVYEQKQALIDQDKAAMNALVGKAQKSEEQSVDFAVDKLVSRKGNKLTRSEALALTQQVEIKRNQEILNALHLDIEASKNREFDPTMDGRTAMRVSPKEQSFRTGLHNKIVEMEGRMSFLTGTNFEKNYNANHTENTNNIDNTMNNISDGGKSVRNVIVNITKMVENVNIHAANVKESGTEITRQVEEIMLRAIQGSELALGN